uniref:Uncharacterized protein n=1 Tax=Oryza meridionalis TaxID=40149 RepID=A0A0E0E258_9ORYZ
MFAMFFLLEGETIYINADIVVNHIQSAHYCFQYSHSPFCRVRRLFHGLKYINFWSLVKANAISSLPHFLLPRTMEVTEVPVASSNHLKSCQDEQSYSGIQASDVRVDDGLKPCQPQDKLNQGTPDHLLCLMHLPLVDAQLFAAFATVGAATPP